MGSEGGRDRGTEGFQTEGKRRPPRSSTGKKIRRVIPKRTRSDPTDRPFPPPANDRYPRGDTPTIPRRG